MTELHLTIPGPPWMWGAALFAWLGLTIYKRTVDAVLAWDRHRLARYLRETRVPPQEEGTRDPFDMY